MGKPKYFTSAKFVYKTITVKDPTYIDEVLPPPLIKYNKFKILQYVIH